MSYPYAYEVLPPIARLLMVIAERLSVGGCFRPGNRQLADWMGYASAGHIVDLLDQLACDGWIDYDRDSRLITLLCDPTEGSPIPPRDRHAGEMEDSEAIPSLDQRSLDGIDSLLIPRRDRVLQQQSAERESIPSRDQLAPRMEDHVLGLAAVDSRDSAAARYNNIPCSPELIPSRDHPAALLLVELGADPVALAEICAAQPDLTPGDVLPQWEIAQEAERTGGARNARRLLFGTLKKPGGKLYGRTASDRVVDWKPYLQAQEQAALAPPDAADADDPPGESYQQRAARIAPADCSGRDMLFLVQQLAQGASDDAALSALASRGKRGAR